MLAILVKLTSIAPNAALVCPNRLFRGEVNEFDIVCYKLWVGCCRHFVGATELGDGGGKIRRRRIRVGGGRINGRRGGREGVESACNGINKNFFEFPTAAAVASCIARVDDDRADPRLVAEHMNLGRPGVLEGFPAALVGELAAGLLLGWVQGHTSMLGKGHGDIDGDADGVRRAEIARVPCEENVSGVKVRLDEPSAVFGNLIGVWAIPRV